MELFLHDSCFLAAILFLMNFQISFDIFLFKHCFLTCFAYDGLHFGENHSFENLCTNTILSGSDYVLFPYGEIGGQLHYCYWSVGSETMSSSVIDKSLFNIMLSELNQNCN